MKRLGIASEQCSQFVVENLYDLLSGCNTANNWFTQRFFLNTRNEFPGDLKIDIRFEQRQAHLAQRCVDIRLADYAMPSELFENFLKLVAKLWKHNLITRPPCARSPAREARARPGLIFLVLAPAMLALRSRLLRFRRSNALRPSFLRISR